MLFQLMAVVAQGNYFECGGAVPTARPVAPRSDLPKPESAQDAVRRTQLNEVAVLDVCEALPYFL